ncbi:MAG: hypothetical protein AB8U25_05275 [Rickettsiales endosymbiont of Dermacentor nuttalli]
MPNNSQEMITTKRLVYKEILDKLNYRIVIMEKLVQTCRSIKNGNSK